MISFNTGDCSLHFDRYLYRIVYLYLKCDLRTNRNGLCSTFNTILNIGVSEYITSVWGLIESYMGINLYPGNVYINQLTSTLV